MEYDPDFRRDTPLARILASEIAAFGPLDLAQFIDRCLFDEAHGYYATRRGIGATGDFITAPEISQVFGELLGGWAAVVARSMAPVDGRLEFVEIGPGRGTMTADALRVIDRVPALAGRMRVTLVETSASLEAEQRRTLAGRGGNISWSNHIPSFDGPTIVLANEVLDVWDLDQSIKTADGWRGRAVGVDQCGQLEFTVSHSRVRDELGAAWPDAPVGSVVGHIGADRLGEAMRAARGGHPLAALFLDYGHEAPALGDTLQAVRAHAFEHPLTSPGEADLTMQVDFADVAGAMRRTGFMVDGPVTQAEFLGAIGIAERASRLITANPGRAADIETGVARLMAPNGMGTRFKVLGVRSPEVPPLPGLAR